MRNKGEKGIARIALIGIIVGVVVILGIFIAVISGITNGKEKENAINQNQEVNQNVAENNTIGSTGDTEDIPVALKWIDNKDGTFTRDGLTVKVGDYVNYDCNVGVTAIDGEYISSQIRNGYGNQTFRASDYTGKWRILGVNEKGQLELVATMNAPQTGNTDSQYYLKGKDGYLNGQEELDTICAIYGKANGATSARSITIEDINKITGYNPNNVGLKDLNQTRTGMKYGAGELDEYGGKVTSTLTSDGIKYSGIIGKEGTATVTTFEYYDEESKTWKLLTNDESVTITSSYYSYYPATLSSKQVSTETVVGISTDSNEYKMLFGDNLSLGSYWLSSKCVTNFPGYASYGLRVVHLGMIDDLTLYRTDAFTKGISGNEVQETGIESNGVRPVVTLSPNSSLQVSLEQNGEAGVWDLK